MPVEIVVILHAPAHGTVTEPTACQPELTVVLRAARKKIWLPAKPWLNVIESINVSVFPLAATDAPEPLTVHWLFCADPPRAPQPLRRMGLPHLRYHPPEIAIP